jgi:hypothetical protein
MRKVGLGLVFGGALAAVVLWLWHPVWLRYQDVLTDHRNRWVPLEWYVRDLGSASPGLRARAARALGYKAYYSDTSAYLAPMLSDPSAEVRGWAVEGLAQARRRHGRLGAMSDSELVAKLRDLLYRDQSRRVRGRASGALVMLREDARADAALRAGVERTLAAARSEGTVGRGWLP